jgi:opacity protein-like surface antigen
MRKFLFVTAAILSLSLGLAVPSARAQEIYEPMNAIQIGMGYQYQHYNLFGTHFNDNGFNVDLYAHIVDWLTDPNWRITVGGEANTAFGFGGQTSGNPSLTAKSLFVGGGPRVAFENRSRVNPWLHGLVGLQHFRFTQDGAFGSNSALGFMVGGGIDVRLLEGLRWRIQGDYIGTNFQNTIQSDYSLGTGFVFVF